MAQLNRYIKLYCTSQSVETRVSKANKLSEGVDAKFYHIFGNTTLLKGEDRTNFRQLKKTVMKLLQPDGLLEEIDAMEIVNNIWESQRYHELGTKLVDAERRNALKHLMNASFGYVSEASDDWLESLEGKPYPDGMTEADVLKKVGLSEELIQATAMLSKAEDCAVLEKLAANRIAARKTSLKDYERRKRLDAKQKRLAEGAKSYKHDLANDNRPAEREIRRTKRS
jgi:hypothetical protein